MVSVTNIPIVQLAYFFSIKLQTRRTKIEGFDLKNADLIQRSGGYLASSITQYRWAKITKEIQSLEIRHGLLKRTRDYFQWLQSQFILKALVDGAIAMLIATDKLVSADIFVFARAMEDAVDFLLTRSRSDSELSEMKTNINILNELADLLEANNNNRKLLRCAIAPSTTTSSSERNYSSLLIPSLMYSRGTTTVRINNLELQPGIYALTGKNGSGKSSKYCIGSYYLLIFSSIIRTLSYMFLLPPLHHQKVFFV